MAHADPIPVLADEHRAVLGEGLHGERGPGERPPGRSRCWSTGSIGAPVGLDPDAAPRLPASGTPTQAVWKSPSSVRTRVSVVNTWCALVERRIAVPAAARVA